MTLRVMQSDFHPDVIIAISRGGVVPARIACDIMGITDLLAVKIDHWFETGEHSEKASVRFPLCADLTGKNALIVDDITDTGSSLETALTHVRSKNPKDVKSATMMHIPTSAYSPDYTGLSVKEWAWFVFPWNINEDVRNLTVKLLRAHPELRGGPKDLAQWFRRFYGIRVSSKRFKESANLLCERRVAAWDDGRLKLLREK